MSLNNNSLYKTPTLVTGIECKVVRLRLLFFVAYQAIIVFKNPIKALKGLHSLLQLRRSVFGNRKITKMIKAGRRYYWSIDFPGFQSENLRLMIRNEFVRIHNRSMGNLQTVIWGITNRCSLGCKHCYDWSNIGPTDRLTINQLKEILLKLRQDKLRHIQLSGGEPINRFNDLITIIESEAARIDFWLLTSGFGLTEDRAIGLKNAGLVGVNISLDHWGSNMHNDFRGNAKSFHWAIQAIKNCRSAGLLVSISLCATKEFVTSENLFKYATLARDNGVHLIRILEARSIGRFSGEDVKICDQQIEILERFVTDINNEPAYIDYPIVNFVGFHQRRIGCKGAGDRYLYIDSMGDFHACPFCQESQGNALHISIEEARNRLASRGCHYLKTGETAV